MCASQKNLQQRKELKFLDTNIMKESRSKTLKTTIKEDALAIKRYFTYQDDHSKKEEESDQTMQLHIDLIKRKEFQFIQQIQNKSIKQNLGEFNVHSNKYFYSNTSFWLFDNKNAFRYWIVWIIEWKFFQYLVTMSILVNSLCLSMYDYSDRMSTYKWNQVIDQVDRALTIIFILEAVLKIIGMGFVIHKKSYLREGWNVIDLVIAISGFIEWFAFDINFKALRVLRVIRPLRTIKAFPSIRKQIGTLIMSLPELANTTIFIAFAMVLLSVLGLQQFQGVLYYRCRITEKPLNTTYWPKSQTFRRVCSVNEAAGGQYQCPKGLFCGSPLQYNISLLDDGVYDDEMIQFGIGNFDNIAQAFIAVFQILTIENWTLIMNNLADGYAQGFTKLYFILIVIIGHYYMLQLLLAVINSNLLKILDQETFHEMSYRKNLKRTFKEELVDKEAEKAIEDEEEQKKAMKNLGDALRKARAAKQEAIRKVDEEAKKKEAMQTQPMTSLQNMAAAIKRAKEEKKAREELERAKKDKEDQLILQEAKNEIQKHSLETEKQHNDQSQYQEVEVRQEDLDRKRQELFEKQRQDQFDEQIKQQMMWNVNSRENNQNKAENILSQGLGLALLSKALGVQSIEGKFQDYLNRLKKTKKMKNLSMRQLVQTKIANEINKFHVDSNSQVSKMYWKSKKKVYGIDNELHLVEQVQKCMKIVNEAAKKDAITHQDIAEIFDSQTQAEKSEVDDPLNWHLPQLDVHFLLSLKLAFNLKELTYQQNVKNFFYTRFKRKLIKQNIIMKVQGKVVQYLIATELELRAQENKIFGFFHYIATLKLFKSLSFVIIIANTIVLGMTKDKESKEFERFLEKLNIFFFGFFIFELLTKLIGTGMKLFFREKFNWFDSSVVIVSAIDVIMQNTLSQESSNTGGAITALRVLRLLRIFQLGKLWKDFQEILGVIVHTLKDVGNISVLILLLLFCFQLIGMELFAYKLPKGVEAEELLKYNHRPNFDTFLEAFISVFIILANDGWTRVYINHYRYTNNPIVSSIFFFTLLTFGQFILLNLFISVLINNFEELSVKNDLIKKLTDLKKDSIFLRIKAWCNRYLTCNKNNAVHEGNLVKGQQKIDELVDQKYQDELRKQDQKLFEQPSLNLFCYDGLIRKVCLKIVLNRQFENIMIIVTIISSIQLGVDNPLRDPSSTYSKMILIIDYVLTAIFALEALIKIIANGLVNSGVRSYFRDITNIMDLFLVLVTVISYLVQNNLNSIKALKLFKLLRPLRALQVNENLRLAVSTLSVAIGEISHVLIVFALFLFVVGIICVNYFKGAFYKCTYNSEFEVQSLLLIEDKWQCVNLGLEWRNSYLNFDDIIQSMCSLFVVSNSIQWSETMFQASQSRGLDMTPDLYGQISPVVTIFFILIVVFGNFFIMNVFIGVILAKYNRESELVGKNQLLTDSQRKWVRQRLNIIYSQPKMKMSVPDNEWRQPFFYIAENVYLQNFIFLCIIVNTVILSLQWYGQSEDFANKMDYVNIFFTAIFTLEFLIKVIGYGKRYFIDKWNIFDMVIVFISIFGIILSTDTYSQVGPQTTIIRSFRIVRIFFFFKSNRALKNTMMTFMLSFPAMFNIGALLMLINLIFSILGMYLFAEIMPNGELNDYTNFSTFGSSFLTLIRTITGEKWPQLMEAVSRSHSPSYQCVSNPTFEDFSQNNYIPVGCGSELPAKIFFFSYSIIMSTVSMKMFIAIIWQTFQQTTERDNKFMSTELVQKFREVWSEFDRNASSFIKTHQYPNFLLDLGEPLGWNVSFKHNYLKQMAYLAEISLPKYNCASEYYFIDVLEHLILIMIIRREVINYGIKTAHLELLGALDEEQFNNYDDLIYQITNGIGITSQKKQKQGNVKQVNQPLIQIPMPLDREEEEEKPLSQQTTNTFDENAVPINQNQFIFDDQVLLGNGDNCQSIFSPIKQQQVKSYETKELIADININNPEEIADSIHCGNSQNLLQDYHRVPSQLNQALATKLNEKISQSLDEYIRKNSIAESMTETDFSEFMRLVGLNTSQIVSQSLKQLVGKTINDQPINNLPQIQPASVNSSFEKLDNDQTVVIKTQNRLHEEEEEEEDQKLQRTLDSMEMINEEMQKMNDSIEMKNRNHENAIVIQESYTEQVQRRLKYLIKEGSTDYKIAKRQEYEEAKETVQSFMRISKIGISPQSKQVPLSKRYHID